DLKNEDKVTHNSAPFTSVVSGIMHRKNEREHHHDERIRSDLQSGARLAYEYHRRALDVRRTGSAAIDLCNIAAGRAELFFELVLSPWDYAAGALIVEEAGGIVTDADGRALSLDRKCSVVARNAVVRPL
ncbi:MAG: hypothetical protein IKZ22_07435, partial [Kiritimatiellae bacterium]|nr:hypothetical protein [Kiritimatiellia bacterium]